MFRTLCRIECFYLDEKLTLPYERTDLSSFLPSLWSVRLIFQHILLFLLGSTKFASVSFSGIKIRSFFTHPHGLRFFYPSAKWFVSDIHAYQTLLVARYIFLSHSLSICGLWKALHCPGTVTPVVQINSFWSLAKQPASSDTWLI